MIREEIVEVLRGCIEKADRFDRYVLTKAMTRPDMDEYCDGLIDGLKIAIELIEEEASDETNG